MSEKVKLVMLNVGLATMVVGSLYWVSQRTEKEIQERINTVNQNYRYSKGVITDLQSYKGRTVKVNYQIREQPYEATLGWDKSPTSLEEGDSIKIRYSVENPALIISELEDEY